MSRGHDWTLSHPGAGVVTCLRCELMKHVDTPDDSPCPAARPPRQVGGDHYQTGDHEPFDVIDEWAVTWKPGAVFYLASALKYVARLGRKGAADAAAQDLDKAIHYLQEARRRFYS